MSDSVQPHIRQPTRLPHPWDSPGKNTWVGCHFLLQCTKVKSESEVTQSCPTLSDPMVCSPPGSSIHGIFQAGVLEWGEDTILKTQILASSKEVDLATLGPSISHRACRRDIRAPVYLIYRSHHQPCCLTPSSPHSLLNAQILDTFGLVIFGEQESCPVSLWTPSHLVPSKVLHWRANTF